MLPLRLTNRRRSVIRRSAVLAFAGFLLTGCVDKPSPTQSVLSPRVHFQLTTSYQRQNAPTARTIDLKIGYARGSAFVPLTQQSIDAVPGTQQAVSVSVDLAPCLADDQRTGAPNGCPLRVSIALRDSVSFALDSVMLAGTAAPGQPLQLPAVDLATARFTVRQWFADDALQLGGRDAPFSTSNTAGLVTGAGAPIIYAASVDSNRLSNGVVPAVSGGPALAVFQNGAWKKFSAHLPSTVSFGRVAPISQTEVWIASTEGLYLFNGTSFSLMTSKDTLTSVAALNTGGSGRLILAVGRGGVVYVSGNAKDFVKITGGSIGTENLNDACITSPTEGFIAGAGGTLWRWDGAASFTVTPSSFTQSKVLLECQGPGQAFVIANGSALLQYNPNSSAWAPPSLSNFPATRLLTWGVRSASEIWAYGDTTSSFNRGFYTTVNGSWREVGRNFFLQGAGGRMWADPRGGSAYVAQSFGRLTQATSSGVNVLSYTPALRDAIVVSPTSAFVVGWNEFLARWNGTSWTVDKPPANSVHVNILQGVWADGPSNAWAVGGASKILHWDGTAWTRVSDNFVPASTPDNYNAVWGQGSTVLAVGDSTILRCTSTTSCRTETGQISASGKLYGIWGSSASDVYAVGEHGRIMHFNGTAWASMASPTTRVLSRVWGSVFSDVWAVGDSVLVHFDGTSWKDVPMTGDLAEMRSPAPATLQVVFQLGLWGSSPKDVYLGSETGKIARFDGTTWRIVETSETNRRVLAISGVSGFGAMAVMEGQSDRGGALLMRGMGPTGGFGAAMIPPAGWP